MRPIVILFIITLLSNACLAQDRVLLGGIVQNHLSAEAVNAVHVLNLTDSLATITSPEGAFRIPVHLGDSLVFTSIGYATKGIIITEKELEPDYIIVKLVQRSYELGEVEVNPFGTKDQFRERFIELEVDDGKIEIAGVKGPSKNRRTIPITEDANEIKKAKHMLSPASFLYGNFSKDAKARQELHKLNRQKEKHKYNYQKFNENTVSKVTGYSGEKLLDFMEFCNFSQSQIYRYNDYELTIAILQKQKAYESRK